MDEIVKKIFEGKSSSEISTMLINLNKFQLNRKPHIKKYNELRKLHGEILDSMEAYIDNGKYNIDEYSKIISSDIMRETKGLEFYIGTDNEDDANIFYELFIYKNHKKISSLTEIYLEKNILRNKEKVKMLNAMKNSYVGLFKVIDVDRENGYVYYQDVFTYKKFKIIDIAMSSTLGMKNNRQIYIYNRIITIDDISFATGIHCMMTNNNKILKEFIKKHKHERCSDFSRCIMLYEISKTGEKLQVNHNHQYGNVR